MIEGPVRAPLEGARRHVVRYDPSELVKIVPVAPGDHVPALISAAKPIDLPAWIQASSGFLDDQFTKHGAVLLRGFGVKDAETFEQVARAFTDDLLNYVEGSSPRTMVTDKVYTSTEYPSPYLISMHNELSYAHRWPAKLFFFCQEAATRGGQTPVADGRRVLAALPARIVHRFAEYGVQYRRLMHSGKGPGLSWSTVFETHDREKVERYCAEGGIQWRWRNDGWLETVQVRPGVVAHPRTGERVWFNQADQWHPSNLGKFSDAMLARPNSERPLDAAYGDGSPIDAADLDVIRSTCGSARVVFDWQHGDILVIDNTMTMHGRMPFEGSRRVLVAMGGSVTLSEVGGQ